ncbi:hypothetical protein Dimus_039524 [Dionaea muscipula]
MVPFPVKFCYLDTQDSANVEISIYQVDNFIRFSICVGRQLKLSDLLLFAIWLSAACQTTDNQRIILVGSFSACGRPHLVGYDQDDDDDETTKILVLCGSTPGPLWVFITTIDPVHLRIKPIKIQY